MPYPSHHLPKYRKHWASGQAIVTLGGKDHYLGPYGTKTAHQGRGRTIAIGPRSQQILKPYLLRDADSYCFSPIDSERKRRAEVHARRQTPMSCGNRPGTNRRRNPRLSPGDRYTTLSYARAVSRAGDKAGVQHWTPNRLRHSCATNIRKRFGLEAAQVVLGHAAADVTQVYAERDLGLAVKVAREVG